ncbi:hypothetical protein ACFL05_00810 [Patescibacteria group bacterium]
MKKVSGEEYIKESTQKFLNEIKDNGGWNLFLRALVAKVLLVSFWYNVSVYISPLDDMFARAGIFVILIVVWGSIRDHLPCWINDLIFTGKGYFKLEIKTLNRYIINLFLCHSIIFLLKKEMPLDKLLKHEE